MKKISILLVLSCLLALFGCSKEVTTGMPQQETQTAVTHELTADEAREIAREAYVFGFPLVMNYKTLYAYTLNKKSKEYNLQLIKLPV